MACIIKCTSILLLFFACHCSFSKTIEVRKNGQHAIQKAIDAAHPNDTILVYQGTYTEHDIQITKPLIIHGIGRPIIDGEHKGEVIIVMADSVVFKGFEIQNVGFSFTKDWAGIKLDNKNYCTIEDNILLDSYFGIYLKKSNHILF